MLRVLICLALALSATAFAPATGVAVSKIQRTDGLSVHMFSGGKKAAPKKVVKKVVKKSSGKKSSTEGKGGILPWVTNEPGTYAKVAMLSSFDFLGADGDKWIGWGAMPDSVKKLYNRNGR